MTTPLARWLVGTFGSPFFYVRAQTAFAARQRAAVFLRCEPGRVGLALSEETEREQLRRKTFAMMAYRVASYVGVNPSYDVWVGSLDAMKRIINEVMPVPPFTRGITQAHAHHADQAPQLDGLPRGDAARPRTQGVRRVGAARVRPRAK